MTRAAFFYGATGVSIGIRSGPRPQITGYNPYWVRIPACEME